MRYLALCTLLALGVSGCGEQATTTPTANNPDNSTATKRADNTAQNARDRENNTLTPVDQNENKADINITADIRKKVVDTKMSTDAKNIKIITQDGKVTLRGPVKSSDEKVRIEEIANAIAGTGKVDSQLEVSLP